MNKEPTERELREQILVAFGLNEEDGKVLDAMQAIAEMAAQEREVFVRGLAAAHEFTTQMGALVRMDSVSDEELERFKIDIGRIATVTVQVDPALSHDTIVVKNVDGSEAGRITNIGKMEVNE